MQKAGLTDEERFLFDLQGYLVIKNALPSDELDRLNAVADQRSSDRSQDPDWNTSIILWGAAYQALIDHPSTLPYLAELIGPRFRLDHDQAIFLKKGEGRGPMHGGQWKMDDWWYQCDHGVIRNGLCVLTYCLTGQRQGDGGFICIPGSHKTNFLGAIPKDVLDLNSQASYIIQPDLEAGDAVFFTEALVHGTMPWTADYERRALIYKFGPGHCASSERRYKPEEFVSPLTDRQRRIIAPPSLYQRPQVDS